MQQQKMYINLVEGRKKVQEIVFRLLNHEMMENSQN